jgi:hypothetical protein
MWTRTLLMVGAGTLLAVRGVGAQAGAADTSASRDPTIVLRADVSAREVRFAKQPEIRVTLVGGTLDSVRVLERRNLPERIVPGATYRDVYIAVEVIGKLHAECLAQMLTGAVSVVHADSTTKRCDVATGAAGTGGATRSP